MVISIKTILLGVNYWRIASNSWMSQYNCPYYSNVHWLNLRVHWFGAISTKWGPINSEMSWFTSLGEPFGFRSHLKGFLSHRGYPHIIQVITLWLCQNSYLKWPSRNSGFSHEKLWFSVVMLVYQRVNQILALKCIFSPMVTWGSPMTQETPVCELSRKWRLDPQKPSKT